MTNNYKPPFLLRYHHFATIYPSFFRKVKGINYQRERIETSDDDFLDLDWSKVGSEKLVIVIHGLEGSADGSYVKGVVRIMNDHGWDALGFNFRGCSGEMNKGAAFYHSGKTDDIDWVVQHAIEKHGYGYIAIVGFSLGGNATLKYAGETGKNIRPEVKKVVGVSVPCDLDGSVDELHKWSNWIYLNRFLVSLKEKVQQKKTLLKDLVDLEKVAKAKNFIEYDDHITGPLHGFANARDYYNKCNSLQFLPTIAIPSLLINAKDDSFLSPTCYPTHVPALNPHFKIETPGYGGHVGFPQFKADGYYWSERRILRFLDGREDDNS